MSFDGGTADCAYPDAEDTVHEVAADEGQYHIGPRVPRVKVGELVSRHVHRVFDLLLNNKRRVNYL